MLPPCFSFVTNLSQKRSCPLRVVRPLQVGPAQDAFEGPRQQRRGELTQDDRHDDVTTLADDATAREVHLKETPVAGEEVGRQHEHGEAALVDALSDRLLQYAARQEVAVMDDGRDLVRLHVL